MNKQCVIGILCGFISVLIPFSCQRAIDYDPQLLSIEEIVSDHPDSALALLSELPPSSFGESSRALYALLVTEAKEKAFVLHSSDSLIRAAVDYFDHTSDLNRRAKAWYYWGRVCQDLLHSEKALACYLKALPIVQKEKDYRLMALIYNYSGTLYRQQNLYDEALRSFQSACRYFELAKDTMNIPYVYRNLGRLYMFSKNPDSAYIFYDKALKLADQYKSYTAKATILNDIGALQQGCEEYEKAIQTIQSSIPLKKKEAKYHSYFSLAWLYLTLNNVDSTQYYLQSAEPSSSLYIQEGIYQCKYKLALLRSDYKSAVVYNEKYQILRDSINRDNQKKEILRLTYRYEQKEAEKELKQKAEKERLIYICCILVLLAIIAVVCYIYNRYRLKQERYRRLQEKKIQQEKELRLRSLAQIRQNEKQIEQNKQKLISREKDLEIIQRKLLEYDTNLLKVENELITLRRDEQNFRDKLFAQTGLPERIRCAGADSRKKDFTCQPFRLREFPLLAEKLDEFYNNFTVRLKTAFPALKERDIQVCCLLKAGAKTSNVSEIIAMTPNAVTKKKRQIMAKMEVVAEKTPLEKFLATF